MKIRLGVIGEEENINILQEVIEEYNDYEITAFIDPDGTHTLNIVLIKEFIAVLILLFYRLQQVRSRCRGHAVPAACAA